MIGVDWDYFDRFDPIRDKYMLPRGEGRTMASQIVTAINKLVYNWYNDGDVFDNTHNIVSWYNDLSDYANWLSQNAKGADEILRKIKRADSGSDYEHLLKDLADLCLNESYLREYNVPKQGSIYKCKSKYVFNEYWEVDDDYD